MAPGENCKIYYLKKIKKEKRSQRKAQIVGGWLPAEATERLGTYTSKANTPGPTKNFKILGCKRYLSRPRNTRFWSVSESPLCCIHEYRTAPEFDFAWTGDETRFRLRLKRYLGHSHLAQCVPNGFQHSQVLQQSTAGLETSWFRFRCFYIGYFLPSVQLNPCFEETPRIADSIFHAPELQYLLSCIYRWFPWVTPTPCPSPPF